MRVLDEGGAGKLICEVEKSELEKFFNCYYKDADPIRKTIHELKAGSSISLSEGYDHLTDIKIAFGRMQDFIKANDSVIKGISKGLLLMTEVRGDDLNT